MYMQCSLEPRLSVPDFVSQLDKIRNGKPGFETTGNVWISLQFS